jgi:hypothetical protein
MTERVFDYMNSSMAGAHDVDDDHGAFSSITRDDARSVEKVPEAVRELRADPARQMFGETLTRERAKAVLDLAPYRNPINGSPYTQKQREAAAHAFAAMSIDLDLSDRELREVVALKPMSKGEAVEAEEKLLRDLERRYPNENDRAERVAVARAMAQRDPRFSAWLEVTRLGSHPRLFELLAERGWSQRAAGKLRI